MPLILGMANGTPLSTAEIRSLSVEASVDPRTIKRFFQGDVVLSLPRSRIVAALQRMGRAALIPGTTTPPTIEPPAKVA